MTNTALRAVVVQSANNTHMVLNVVHEKFGVGRVLRLLSQGVDVKRYWDS